MAMVTTDSQHYQAIADAIREKNGLTDAYQPAQMAAAIQALSGGGTPVTTGTFYAASQTMEITFDIGMTNPKYVLLFHISGPTYNPYVPGHIVYWHTNFQKVLVACRKFSSSTSSNDSIYSYNGNQQYHYLLSGTSFTMKVYTSDCHLYSNYVWVAVGQS